METLKELYLYGKDEWTTLSQAPGTFTLFAILAAWLGYKAASWHFSGVIATLNERLALRAEQAEVSQEKANLWDGMAATVATSDAPHLREKALTLVADLREFLQRYKREDNEILHSNRIGNHARDALTEEERIAMFHKHTQRMMDNSENQRQEYLRRFKTAAKLLRNELSARLKDYKSDIAAESSYDFPTNSFCYQAVADDLEQMAKLLK